MVMFTVNISRHIVEMLVNGCILGIEQEYYGWMNVALGCGPGVEHKYCEWMNVAQVRPGEGGIEHEWWCGVNRVPGPWE